jgi:spore germination protein
MVLIVPVTVGMFLQSPEDYYERWMVGSLIRALRYIAAFLAVFAPAFYIALVTYHPGLIPSDLAFSIAATREGVPFPAVVEALMMVTTMELLQEAGLRLPKPIGQTVGIVGGLVIGEAAVAAGIVSPVMVIVVAMTAIASFAIPAYNLALAFRLIRFIAMIGAAIGRTLSCGLPSRFSANGRRCIRQKTQLGLRQEIRHECFSLRGSENRI